jgi:hypothetical protein
MRLVRAATSIATSIAEDVAVYRQISTPVYPCTMKKHISKLSLLFLATILLGACQNNPAKSRPTVAPASAQRAWFDGEYDNHEQVALSGSPAVARVQIEITPLQKAGWYAWKVRMSGTSELTAAWVMRSLKRVDGSLELTPYRTLTATATPDKDFDPDQWVALDACTLRGAATASGLEVRADLANCATVAPGIGTTAALLPLEIRHDGDALSVRLYSDQARGPDARIEARLVRWYGGWAAINGAGPNATAESTDWHMNRGLRISNEGGLASLVWRDGKASGYSLELERATYRDGNVPVLKLSVVEDASGRTIAYAWANPEATRIGINLGWVQVGLDVAANATQQ